MDYLGSEIHVHVDVATRSFMGFICFKEACCKVLNETDLGQNWTTTLSSELVQYTEDAMPKGLVIRVESERGILVALFDSGRLKERRGL